MIKKVFEQNDTPLGLTEWWELAKKYEAIIFVKDPECTLQLSDGLSGRHVEPRHNDPTGIVYKLLISKYHFDKDEYTLQQSAYGTGIIDFPIQKKMEVLETVDLIIAENSIF